MRDVLVGDDDLLLPDIVPGALAGPILLVEEVVLQRNLVDSCPTGTA